MIHNKLTLVNNLVTQTNEMAKAFGDYKKISNKLAYGFNKLKRAYHRMKVRSRKANR